MKQHRRFFSGKIYHICNKSIANFGIFKSSSDGQRFVQTLDYYNNSQIVERFSEVIRQKKYKYINLLIPKRITLVKFLAYCIMPDHYHILLKILRKNSLSSYIANIENSYTRFFNVKHLRKGPLWQSRFRAIVIKTNQQLLHVSRYIHLNPTTDYLVEDPIEWKLSSYRDYISNKKFLGKFLHEMSIRSPVRYKSFVENQKDHQRNLKKIKKLLLEQFIDYSNRPLHTS